MMVEKVKEIINSLSNLDLWSIWDDIPEFLDIAKSVDDGKPLSTWHKKRLKMILSYGGNNDK